MRRLFRLLLLILLVLTLLGPSARAQDFHVVSSSPAPGDSSVALRDTVTFTFSAPLDTTHRFEDAGTDWPVAFAAISPRDSLQIDSVRYSDDLTQIHFDVTHTDEADFVWIMTGAQKDTSETVGLWAKRLAQPYVASYTTAEQRGTYSMSGCVSLVIVAKSFWTDPFVPILLDASPPDGRVAAAATVDDDCSYSISGVREGIYWPALLWDEDEDGSIQHGWSPSYWSTHENMFLDLDHDQEPDSLRIASSVQDVRFSVALASSTEQEGVPAVVDLLAPHPNPFRTSTRLPLTLEHPARVRLVVYDLLGRRVATLADGFYPAGEHAAMWQAEDAPPGVYLVRLEGDGFVLARPVVRVR